MSKMIYLQSIRSRRPSLAPPVQGHISGIPSGYFSFFFIDFPTFSFEALERRRRVCREK